MAERGANPRFKRTGTPADPGSQPQTRHDLDKWVRNQLNLPAATEAALLAAIDAVFSRHERLWQESKHEAIQALSSGFADKMAHVQSELLAEGRHRQQHLAIFRRARRGPHRPVAARSQDEADELRPLHRAARVVSRARAARPLVRGRPRRHHRIQVVQRRARSRRGRSDHRARRRAAARTGAVRRSPRAGARAASRGSPRALRRRRILLSDSGSRRVHSGVRRRRAVPPGGRTL